MRRNTGWKIVEIDGRQYFMDVKISWNKVYRSFDAGETWHPTRKDAFAAAKQSGKLRSPQAATR